MYTAPYCYDQQGGLANVCYLSSTKGMIHITSGISLTIRTFMNKVM